MLLPEELAWLDPSLRRAIKLWLMTPVSICRICDEPVYPTCLSVDDPDPRSAFDYRIHRSCLGKPSVRPGGRAFLL